MIIICNIDAPISCLIMINKVKDIMLQINPKKFTAIKNKTIPNPLRPKFRGKSQTSIYFLSQRKVSTEKKAQIIRNIKISTLLTAVVIGGYFLSN
jgi:hypothetical protein